MDFNFVQLIHEYEDTVLDYYTKELFDQVDSAQIIAAQVVTGATRRSSHEFI